ncbi:hypothetical protein [Sphingomonas psychrolutea]|uniref:Uncharacterized protein n=1 Tax=Sphingomonas psychrolutea TaxID=1259676 RepID=A0ABQ1H8P1_9SPHN|nr:hypothetical protein [Sphingomonas psychrolutea]GGA62198.1 hypothetical protein GCM10011395_35560 [Sphingomonas psychrolutea]
MDMSQYLREMAHAVQTFIPAVWVEHDNVNVISAKVAKLEAATTDGYQRVQEILQVDEADEDGLATALHWDTYFGVDKETYHAGKELDALRQQEDARAFSRSAMSSTILHFAKQGISVVHGDLKGSPPGRDVHGICLSELIWMGRNQGLHWEEGGFGKGVTAVFDKLAAADAVFGDYTDRSMGFEIVSLLGWRDYAAFESDLQSLS